MFYKMLLLIKLTTLSSRWQKIRQLLAGVKLSVISVVFTTAKAGGRGLVGAVDD